MPRQVKQGILDDLIISFDGVKNWTQEAPGRPVSACSVRPSAGPGLAQAEKVRKRSRQNGSVGPLIDDLVVKARTSEVQRIPSQGCLPA